VLIIGGPEALQDKDRILDSLGHTGVDLTLVGVAIHGFDGVTQHPASQGDPPIYEDYVRVIEQEKPELILVTSDETELRAHLRAIVPPETRILDSFALKALDELKALSGQLGTTQEKLESVELMKQVLMQGSEVSIMVVDEDLKVVDIGNATLTRTKMSRQASIGRPCHWVIHRSMEPCEIHGSDCAVKQVLRTGRPTHSVREDLRDDGTVRYYTRSAYPLKPDCHGKRSALIVWKDVTNGMAPVLDRQARNIRENFAHILHQDKMIALGKLAAAAVHEINNPIQGIMTFSFLMRSWLDKPFLTPEELDKFRDYLDLISKESARCGQILRNLLSFSRQSDLKRACFDLSTVFDEVFLLLGNRIELQNVRVVRKVALDLPAVCGDRGQIKQAILNLVLNAVEAMPDGGIVDVRAESDSTGDLVRIRIRDTGAGIPEHVQRSIFEPFVTTKQEGKGVGLGLSVVYGIVTQHGGAIEVESDEGSGATFLITLPAGKDCLGENSY